MNDYVCKGQTIERLREKVWRELKAKTTLYSKVLNKIGNSSIAQVTKNGKSYRTLMLTHTIFSWFRVKVGENKKEESTYLLSTYLLSTFIY